MLNAYLDGIRDADLSVEIEIVHVYDLDYKGCRACYGCKLKTAGETQCVVKDDAYDVLRKIRSADGLVIASPIYYWDVTAHLRELLERLYYPGLCDHAMPVTAIYTMNQPEEVAEERFRPFFNALRFFNERAFQCEMEEILVNETLHWDHPELYTFDEELYKSRKVRSETVFPKELASVRERGALFAKKVSDMSKSRS